MRQTNTQQTELLRKAHLAAQQAGLETQGAVLWLSGYHQARAEDADLLAACEAVLSAHWEEHDGDDEFLADVEETLGGPAQKVRSLRLLRVAITKAKGC